MSKPVTARDVARVAGVSQATVSYVVNDSPTQKISAETRARVLAAVERLGYTPSAAARALRRGTSDIVLLLIPDLPYGPTVASMIEELTDALEPVGLSTVTRRMRSGRPVDDLWRDIRPVAVVVIGGLGDADEAALGQAGIPVLTTTLMPASGHPGVVVPQTVIGRLQVEHLAATGHRRIGYAAPDDARVSDFYRLRLDGVRTACLDLGLDDPVVIPVHLDAADGERAVLRWRGLEPPVTGVAAYNDETAFALIAGLHRAGLAAPRDLAVIGVDNIPLAGLATPALTTVDQSIPAMAAFLAASVAHLVQGAPAPEPLGEDTVTLVVRESA